MKEFLCGDLIPGCGVAFTGTEDAILGDVAAHAADDHGMLTVPEGLVDQVRDAMVPA